MNPVLERQVAAIGVLIVPAPADGILADCIL
jgi:hypothetical protein